MSTNRAACAPTVKTCPGWCNPLYAATDCNNCKCANCKFCRPAGALAESPPAVPSVAALPASTATWRLKASGQQLLDPWQRPVVLQGVNVYMEWYRSFYGAVWGGSSAYDIPHLRQALPAANCVRFVGILWHDSIMSSDGLECSNDDPSTGYIDPTCLRYVDAMVKQATDAGLWVSEQLPFSSTATHQHALMGFWQRSRLQPNHHALLARLSSLRVPSTLRAGG